MGRVIVYICKFFCLSFSVYLVIKEKQLDLSKSKSVGIYRVV